MKLLTHNMLTSNFIKGVTKGYPLTINAKKVEVKETEFNREFISRIVQKVDWPALCKAVTEVGHAENFPQEMSQDFESDEEFLKRAHHVLLEIEIKEGDLICPESGRTFPINNGIANMLLNEDEV